MNVAIIGSFWGDEGKGLSTDFFSSKIEEDGYVIRYNGSAQAGHCQTADTLIVGEHGIYYLGDVVGSKTHKNNIPLINMIGDIEDTSLLYRKKNSVINKILLRNGVVLKCTPEHKYYVWDSENSSMRWVESNQLKKDIHQFCFPKNYFNYKGTDPTYLINSYETKNKSTIKYSLDKCKVDSNILAEMCGLFNGDGYFAKGYITLSVYIKQDDVAEWVKLNIESYGFNVIKKRHFSSNECILLYIHSVDFLNFLEHMGCCLAKEENKRTPRFVMQGTKDIIISYIRGIFESDGTIKFHNSRYGRISVSNISEFLLRELQQLFYLIGINSVLSKEISKKGRKDIYSLEISSYEDIQKYASLVNFRSKYKFDKLKMLLDIKNINRNPNILGNLLKINVSEKMKLLKECGLQGRKGEHIRTSLVLNNMDKIQNKNLCNVCSDYHIVDILDVIKNAEITDVYDVSMPLTHSYIANGTISHNTVAADNRTHVFHHIGSGTFNGTPTFLSKFFVVHPMLFREEYETLKDLKPIVYVDDRCFVITPYDMLINQAREKSRCSMKHGSVGLGFNECITRSLDFLTLDVSELFYNRNILLNKIRRIRDEYAIPALEELNAMEELQYAHSNNILLNFMEDVEFFIDNVKYIHYYKGIDVNKSFIFEGAQGLMLDEDFGYFPNVTRSRTGTKNILTLSNELGIKIDNIYRITRSYLTRHGRGELPLECSKEDISSHINETTNTFNEYQEHLRFAPFNFQLLEYVLKQDYVSYINSNIVLTCMDQMNELIPIIDVQGNKRHIFRNEFLEMMKRYGTKYVSYGPRRKDVVEIYI